MSLKFAKYYDLEHKTRHPVFDLRMLTSVEFKTSPKNIQHKISKRISHIFTIFHQISKGGFD